jgi:PAS domain S-box-containing protein
MYLALAPVHKCRRLPGKRRAELSETSSLRRGTIPMDASSWGALLSAPRRPVRITTVKHDGKGTAKLIEERRLTQRRNTNLEKTEAERRRVQKALSNPETQFRKITEQSIVGVYLIQDDLFRYVNPKMAEIFGYEVHELVDTRGPQDVAASDDWPRVSENLRKRISGEAESLNYSFKGIKSSGEIVHIEVYGSRTDYQGRPAVIGTILDITHRVEAERNLQTQLHRFKVLYHIAMSMAAGHTLEQNLSLLVDQCRELLGANVLLIAVSDGDPQRLRICARSGLRRDGLTELPGGFLTDAEAAGRTDQPVPDAEACFRRLEAVAPHELRREGLQSGIAIPLRIKERALGVLCAGSREKRIFSESEKDVLSLMANMAALEVTRKQAEEALAQSEKQLRLLSTRLLKGQEDDRKLVAQELHDGIGQSLSAIKFRLESVVRQVGSNVSQSDRASLEMLVTMIQGTIEEVRQIAMDLRPSILDDLGLVATFSWVLREFQNTYCDMKLIKRIGLNEHEIPEPLKIVIFRVAQEALNNGAKHSCGSRVHVSLEKKRGRIQLSVRDDGIGFDEHSAQKSWSSGGGFGLASMKERTELSGGTFHLETRPGHGTTIKASWPVQGPETCR